MAKKVTCQWRPSFVWLQPPVFNDGWSLIRALAQNSFFRKCLCETYTHSKCKQHLSLQINEVTFTSKYHSEFKTKPEARFLKPYSDVTLHFETALVHAATATVDPYMATGCRLCFRNRCKFNVIDPQLSKESVHKVVLILIVAQILMSPHNSRSSCWSIPLAVGWGSMFLSSEGVNSTSGCKHKKVKVHWIMIKNTVLMLTMADLDFSTLLPAQYYNNINPVWMQLPVLVSACTRWLIKT